MTSFFTGMMDFDPTVAGASIFLEFLESLFINTADIINSALPAVAHRSQEFKYSEVVIAHSLGAVITRWALMMAFEQGRLAYPILMRWSAA